MDLQFDATNVRTTEFGVGRYRDDNPWFGIVPARRDVQDALIGIVSSTWTQMDKMEDKVYDPSDKTSAAEYSYLALTDDLAELFRDLHEARNLDPTTLSDDLAQVFCYFARLTDDQGRVLLALRRSTQFKGMLKKKLLSFGDTLEFVDGTVFQLNADFDVLVDTSNVHILHPSGLIALGKLEEAIMNAMPRNLDYLATHLPELDCSTIQSYSNTRPRAAKLLASIRASNYAESLDMDALKDLCRKANVEFDMSSGVLEVAEKDTLRFLEIVDRRIYESRLRLNAPEPFRAESRQSLSLN